MNVGIVLFAVSAVWIASEVMLVLLRRSGADSKKRDSGSIVWLNAVIYGSVAVAVYIRVTGVGMVPSVGLTLSRIGLVFILMGLAIRWAAIFTLRQYFTVNVAIQPNHRIVRKGLYGLVRHPSYLGSITSFVGLGLALSNWIALGFLVIPITYVFLKRIRIEERALRQEFGPEYDQYCRTTWLLIPWLY